MLVTDSQPFDDHIMASILAGMKEAATSTPALDVALSGIFGSVSMTAWICLLIPQLLTNYKAGNADGLSMGFLFIWLFGDVTNLAGALISKLPPTAVALGCYFCIADVTLIGQSLYYNYKSQRRLAGHHVGHRRRLSSEATAVSDVSEDEPLLARRRSSSFGATANPAHGLPGSHVRHESRRESSSLDPLTRMITGEDETPDANPWLHNALSLLAVWAVGVAGWFLSYKTGAWNATDGGGADPDAVATEGTMEMIGLGLGYVSAVCYLLARIPQILKNYRQKSCEGLALLFFLLSFTGNSTYGASLFAFSQEPAYLFKALPWLLGSFGTIAEDAVIFVQFRLYSAEPGLDKVMPDEEHEAADG